MTLRILSELAPELLSGQGSYSQATDVYAFGMIMWEISSQEKPFHDLVHDKMLALRILKGFRPEITKETPPFYQDLIQKCWHSDPTQRPTAKEIYDFANEWNEQEIKDQIKKSEEIRQKNIPMKKEKKTDKITFKTNHLLLFLTLLIFNYYFNFNQDHHLGSLTSI